jgi:hypothetical protein
MSRSAGADERVEDAIAQAVIGDVADDAPHDFLALVGRSAEAERVTNRLLQQSVDRARANGHSWAAIGEVLGMSRQAAQQRFGTTRSSPPAEADERWLGPVTAFDEMAELAVAGRRGWHTVEAGFLSHRMVRTDTQWEHRRVLWRAPASRLARDGWQIGCRAFPWLYLVRDTGLPVPSDAAELEA